LSLLVFFGNLEGERSRAEKPKKIENSPVNKRVWLFNNKNLGGWYFFIEGRGRNQDDKKVFSERVTFSLSVMVLPNFR
jgi:hypothetical protein